MKRTILLLAILLAACSPFAPAPSQQGQNQPTAYIDPSYPTMQSAPLTVMKQANSIEVSADRAWRDGKQVNVNVCFTLLDNTDWSIYSANLQYGGQTISDFGTTMVSVQDPANGQPGKRCDTLSFVNVPPDADLSNVAVTINSIGAPPNADEYCTILMPKIQEALNQRGAGITLGCSDVNGTQTMQITGKPDTMTQEQAEQLVYSDEFYTVKGPWSFTFNLGQ